MTGPHPLATLRQLVTCENTFPIPAVKVHRLQDLARTHAQLYLCDDLNGRPGAAATRAATALVLLLEAFGRSPGDRRKLMVFAASSLSRAECLPPTLFPIRSGGPALGVCLDGHFLRVSPESLRRGNLDAFALVAAIEAIRRATGKPSKFPWVGMHTGSEELGGWYELGLEIHGSPIDLGSLT